MNPSATPGTLPYPDDPTWPRSEKIIARTVFDAALKRELQAVMREAKQKANQIKGPTDVWELERYLTQRREGIDRKYEFRSSRITQVLGILLSEGRIREDELRGLGQDKVNSIRACAEFVSKDVA